MNDEEQAYHIYQAWGKLSRAEGEAIRAADWTRVAQSQQRKAELQHKLLELDHGAATGKANQRRCLTLNPRLRTLVEELFRQEKENEAELARQRKQAERRRGELSQAQRQLRQLRRAYVPSRRSHWSTYS